MLIKGPSFRASTSSRLARLAGLDDSTRKSRKLLVGLFVFCMVLFQAAGLFAVARWAKGGGMVREATRARHWLDSHLDTGAEPAIFDIDISFKNHQKLAFLREQAFETGAIQTTGESWIPAAIRSGGREVPVRMRLKGDVTNHLEGDKWSFRIRVKGGKALYGMKNFSVQDPERSGFVHEWILHRLLRHEGLISLRYDFIDVRINGKRVGIHALEESFSKEMLEANHRREGPILKFDESYLWNRKAWRYESIPGQVDVFHAASIDSFQTSRINENPGLSAQFERARTLLAGFRDGERSVAETFDIEATARLFAVLDLTTGWHAARWKNIRFYANPVTGLLEPIAYNAYDSEPRPQNMVYGAGPAAYQMYQLPEWMEAFFRDPDLHDRYVRQLDRISREGYLEGFFEKEKQSLARAVSIIHRDDPGFVFSRDTYFENRDLIRRLINPELPVRVKHERAAGTARLAIANTGYLPIELVRLQGDDASSSSLAGTRIRGKQGPAPVWIGFDVESGVSRGEGLQLVYKVAGIEGVESERAVPVEEPPAAGLPWVQPDAATALRHLEIHPGFSVLPDEKRVHLQGGEWNLPSTIVIPAGYSLTAGPGTTLSLGHGASLISFGSLSFEGATGAPLVLEGDGSGGLAVIGATDGSTLRHVEFHRLGVPQELGLGMTGGVTLYESPVVIEAATFADTRVEDQLNIVRSRFEIRQGVFRTATGDCLDIDFGDGVIESSLFEGCGNDGIDVSGTTVTIRDTEIRHAGDKAVSAGEASRVTLVSVRTIDSGLGVASKDLSRVTGESVSIEGCRFGIGAYQKKPEYGPATISLVTSRISGAETTLRVEAGSMVTLDGLAHHGQELGLAGQLYDN